MHIQYTDGRIHTFNRALNIVIKMKRLYR